MSSNLLNKLYQNIISDINLLEWVYYKIQNQKVKKLLKNVQYRLNLIKQEIITQLQKNNPQFDDLNIWKNAQLDLKNEITFWINRDEKKLLLKIINQFKISQEFFKQINNQKRLVTAYSNIIINAMKALDKEIEAK